MIDGRRVITAIVRLGAGSMQSRDAAGNFAESPLDQVSHLRTKAARGAADMQFVRDYIVGRAAPHKADTDDRGVERVDVAATDRLQRQHDLRTDHKRVGAEMGM